MPREAAKAIYRRSVARRRSGPPGLSRHRPPCAPQNNLLELDRDTKGRVGLIERQLPPFARRLRP
jgi:hypothetical protein